MTDHIEKVALAALADRKPATLARGVGKVGFAANRRSFPLKPIDHDLPVLRATDAEGKRRASASARLVYEPAAAGKEEVRSQARWSAARPSS